MNGLEGLPTISVFIGYEGDTRLQPSAAEALRRSCKKEERKLFEDKYVGALLLLDELAEYMGVPLRSVLPAIAEDKEAKR